MEHIEITPLDVTNSHIIELWDGGGRFLQSLWDLLLEFTGDSPCTLYVFGTFIITTVEYWLISAIYYLLDTCKSTSFLRQRYKIIERSASTADSPYENKTRIVKVARNVLINQIFISIPVGYLTYLLGNIRGHMPVQELPSLFRLLFDLSILICCEEIGFYYVHRLLHHRFFYNRFHRVHHEWQTPIAMAAIYCHPVEHIFCNLMPIFGGFLLLGSHVFTCWLWICSVYFVVLNDHSGYHFPFFLSSEAHDFHHRKSTTFFGVFGVLDGLHRTDDVWRNSNGYARHSLRITLKALERK